MRVIFDYAEQRPGKAIKLGVYRETGSKMAKTMWPRGSEGRELAIKSHGAEVAEW